MVRELQDSRIDRSSSFNILLGSARRPGNVGKVSPLLCFVIKSLRNIIKDSNVVISSHLAPVLSTILSPIETSNEIIKRTTCLIVYYGSSTASLVFLGIYTSL